MATKRPTIISRKAALRRGLSYYFTGKPCKRGHFVKRNTAGRWCVECAEITNRRYLHSPQGRKARKKYVHSQARKEALYRYNHSPKGEDARWRYGKTPKGSEVQRCYRQSPKGSEKIWQRIHSPEYQEAARRRQRQQSPNARAAHNDSNRKYTLSRIEAAYAENPTAKNWNRLQNLIARRIRDGR